MANPSGASKLRLIRQAVTSRAFLWLTVGWLLISVAQTLHFYWYFEQTLEDSIRWAFRDWFVWFLIFGFLFSIVVDRPGLTRFSFRSLAIVACIALVCGFAQTFIVVAMEYITGNSTRPFWDDFWRFYSKRWLQQLFVFAIFWLLMVNRWYAQKNERDRCEANKKTVTDKIKINDGKNNHWLDPQDIVCIEAAGNYMCIHTASEQLISRSSLKHFEDMLDKHRFIRVSRSSLVNTEKIVSSHRVTRSKVELTLSNQQTVTIGPTYWADVKARLAL